MGKFSATGQPSPYYQRVFSHSIKHSLFSTCGVTFSVNSENVSNSDIMPSVPAFKKKKKLLFKFVTLLFSPVLLDNVSAGVRF